MMLSLPESLLLFALHDQRGTLRSSAYLSIDAALAGAVLGELVLRGNLRLRSDGDTRWDDRRTDSPLLQAALEALEDTPTHGRIEALLVALETNLPDLRDRVTTALVSRGALARDVIDREGLADTSTLPAQDGTFEEAMIQHVRAAVACGSSVPRRLGLLVALIHLCELWPAFDDPSLAGQGRILGEWVLGRDRLVQAVHITIQKAEGTYDM